MRCNRILCILRYAVAVVLLCASPLWASSLIVSSDLAMPADTGQRITVSLGNSTALAGLELVISYSANELRLDSIAPTARLAGLTGTGYHEFTSGDVVLLAFDFSGVSLPAATGTIFEMFFRVDPLAPSGNYPISIASAAAVLPNLQYDSVASTDGSIQVLGPCPVSLTGDVNLAGGVVTSDIVYLINFVLKGGPAPLPCTASGDVNCDAEVRTSDIIYLVNSVLKGGPAPCNVCPLRLTGQWVCP